MPDVSGVETGSEARPFRGTAEMVGQGIADALAPFPRSI